MARGHGAKVLMDNTWGTPYLFRSFEHGVDVSIHAATKYICGHSDAMLGAVITNESVAAGAPARPADRPQRRHRGVFFGLRGMRTIGVRLERHQRNAIEVARWLEPRPEVVAGALSGVARATRSTRSGSAISSAPAGCFVVLKPCSKEALAAMIDALELFGIGASWGGFESLVLPFDAATARTATAWRPEGPTVRLHIGLEDVADLEADLAAGFARFAAAASTAGDTRPRPPRGRRPGRARQPG